MTNIIIQSPRTIMRRFTLHDLENFKKLESDPDVMINTPSRIPQTAEESQKRLEALVAKESDYGSYGVWSVELKDTQDFIGWFMLIPTDLEHPELGFMIVKKYWNQGFATEVSQALLQYGFNVLKLKKISSRTDVNNKISIRVLEKLGFKYIRTITVKDRVFLTDNNLNVYEKTQ